MYHTIVMVSVVGLTLKGQATSHHFEGTLGSAQRETGAFTLGPPPPPVPLRDCRPYRAYCARPCVDRSVLWSGAKTVCSATKPAPLADVSTMPCCAASPGNNRPTSML